MLHLMISISSFVFWPSYIQLWVIEPHLYSWSMKLAFCSQNELNRLLFKVCGFCQYCSDIEASFCKVWISLICMLIVVLSCFFVFCSNSPQPVLCIPKFILVVKIEKPQSGPRLCIYPKISVKYSRIPFPLAHFLQIFMTLLNNTNPL